MSGAPAWTVAVLGFGEAGAGIATGLASAGAHVRGYDPVVAAPPGVAPATSDADACTGADRNITAWISESFGILESF